MTVRRRVDESNTRRAWVEAAWFVLDMAGYRLRLGDIDRSEYDRLRGNVEVVLTADELRVVDRALEGDVGSTVAAFFRREVGGVSPDPFEFADAVRAMGWRHGREGRQIWSPAPHRGA